MFIGKVDKRANKQKTFLPQNRKKKGSMTEALKVYLEASKRSFVGQSDEIVIPTLPGEIGVKTLGFQPICLVSRRMVDGKIQVAGGNYEAPAAFIADVSKNDAGICLKMNWMRGAELCQHFLDGSVETGRCGFPEPTREFGGANRCQTVNFGSSGNLYVSRGNDRVLYHVVPPEGDRKRWRTVGAIHLPVHESGYRSLSSALMVEDDLYTIESNASGGVIVYYTRQEGGEYIPLSVSLQLPPCRLGIAFAKNGDMVTITDFATKEKPGIYIGNELAVPDVCGTGICLLPPPIGGAMVACYGQGHPGQSGGVPGAFIYVPAEKFPDGTF